MSRGAKVIVAGAGALGLSTALALADAGCAVSVRDPASAGQASAVAAGMLAPVFEAALDAEMAGDLGLLLAARNLWPGLAARAGIVLDRSGTAAVGAEAWLAEIRARFAGLGVRGAALPHAMLQDLAPGVAPGLEGLLVREDWRVEARPALAALRAACEAVGVTFDPRPVEEREPCDALVIATGAAQGLAGVAPELAHLSPIKGQILSCTSHPSGPFCLRGEGAYAVPGVDGLTVGATMEPGRCDSEPDPLALAPLIRAAQALFPGLAETEFAVSAGVRAATPDGLPMVGVSQAPGVILAVGARRNGWLLAPLVADVVTACLTGRDSGPYAARFDPGRFAAGRAR